MTADRVFGAVRGFVLRQWWIVLIAVAGAVVASMALTPGNRDTYRAEAGVAVDTGVIGRSPGAPGPDRLLRETKGRAFREALAHTLGVEAGEVAGVRVYTQGTPTERVMVSFDDEDKAKAERVSDAGGALVVEIALGLASAEISRQNAFVAQTEKAITTLEEVDPETGWERADLAFKLRELNMGLVDAQTLLANYDNCYVYSGDVNVSTKGAAATSLELAAGVGFIGLVAGIGVGLARERRTAKKAG